MGGAERVALDLATAQREIGHEVSVVALDPENGGPLQADFEARGISTHIVAQRTGFDGTLFPRLAARYLAWRVTVVHTHNPKSLIYGAPAGRLVGAVVVHTKHGEGRDTGRAFALRRTAARFCQRMVAVSEQTAVFARERREIDPKRLVVIENGIDIERFSFRAADRQAMRRELGFSDDTRVIATVGRLEPIKNQELLLRAAAPLLGPRCKLMLVGEGPERDALVQRGRELAISDHVMFAGLRRDIPRVLSAIDLFVLSSHSEGMPLVVLEAMSAGLPVLTTAVGGLPRLIDDGQTGLLVPAGDEEAMRSRMALVLNDLSKPDFGRQLGDRARALVCHKHSLAQMARAYDELYEQIGRRPIWRRMLGA
jgi:glycosyltransferase involved in cell wall biosynthesis